MVKSRFNVVVWWEYIEIWLQSYAWQKARAPYLVLKLILSGQDCFVSFQASMVAFLPTFNPWVWWFVPVTSSSILCQWNTHPIFTKHIWCTTLLVVFWNKTICQFPSRMTVSCYLCIAAKSAKCWFVSGPFEKEKRSCTWWQESWALTECSGTSCSAAYIFFVGMLQVCRALLWDFC